MSVRHPRLPICLRAVVFSILLSTQHFLLSTAAAKQPAFFEPKEHFYKAKGVGVAVKWEVPRPVVEDGRELTATLVVTRATNPTEVVRPDLKAVPAFADRFTVTDVPGPPPAAGAKELRFAYTLRPRNRTVDRVPALEFSYFNTAAGPGTNPFRKTQADSVPITVTEQPKAPKRVEPMVEADHLFHVATGPAVLRGPFVPCRWAWGAAALFGPLAAVACRPPGDGRDPQVRPRAGPARGHRRRGAGLPADAVPATRKRGDAVGDRCRTFRGEGSGRSGRGDGRRVPRVRPRPVRAPR